MTSRSSSPRPSSRSPSSPRPSSRPTSSRRPSCPRPSWPSSSSLRPSSPSSCVPSSSYLLPPSTSPLSPVVRGLFHFERSGDYGVIGEAHARLAAGAHLAPLGGQLVGLLDHPRAARQQVV